MKVHLEHDRLLDVLESRGMQIGNRLLAREVLERVSYYRLSGYWYPFRQVVGGHRADQFFPGTDFSQVIALHTFDAELRAAAFATLSTIEVSFRARLGHALGALHPLAHLSPQHLGLRASGGPYRSWVARYHAAVDASREDFVVHHRRAHGGELPVWVAMEVLDWGALTRLYGFAPRTVQDAVAAKFQLSAPQMESWMKALNIVRNVCAHHGRLFNRVFVLTPRLPRSPHRQQLDECAPFSRCFGLLSLAQFLIAHGRLERSQKLRDALAGFPSMPTVSLAHVGAPTSWRNCALWRTPPAGRG